MKDGLYYRGQRLNSNTLGEPSLEPPDDEDQETEQEREDEKGLAEYDRWQDAQEDA